MDEKTKENLKELYEHGRELYEKGKYAEAEWMLKEVIMIRPDYADVLNKLGVIANLDGRCEDAVNYLTRALKLNPQYTEASLNLAVTYNEMGEFDKAQDVFVKASQIAASSPMRIDPFVAGKLANEHFRLGNTYCDFFLYDEAIEEYRKALKLRPTLADVHTKLGIALRSKELYDEAVEHFTKAKEANPYYWPARVQLGLTYYMKGLSGLAFEEWEDALKQNPDLSEAKSFLHLLKKDE
ncbi:MAG: tetratricopeptide repeat protein [Thermodesulfovibrionales bacterium]|nr:tetratricopeptide repeat protein [Thermodesulfovibrionales bacterium]